MMVIKHLKFDLETGYGYLFNAPSNSQYYYNRT
jgi:hypothetical protein